MLKILTLIEKGKALTTAAKETDVRKFEEIVKKHHMLKTGDFTAKSGIKTHFFMNLGDLCSGQDFRYINGKIAEMINDIYPNTEPVIFGPAYKGIPLAAGVVTELGALHARDFSFAYNRKELKDHGEQGWLVGAKLEKGAEVIIVEDVLTLGTSISESIKLIRETGATVKRAFVIFNREERRENGVFVSDQLFKEQGIEIFSLFSLSDIDFTRCT